MLDIKPELALSDLKRAKILCYPNISINDRRFSIIFNE